MTLANNCWIKLGIIIFGYAHSHSRTDSRALRAEYCIVDIPHNTARGLAI